MRSRRLASKKEVAKAVLRLVQEAEEEEEKGNKKIFSLVGTS